MHAYPNVLLKLGGYTDNTGSDNVNIPLSQKRANMVKTELENLGVNKERLNAEGYGSKHPICPANDTNVCKAQNRRVDVRITKK